MMIKDAIRVFSKAFPNKKVIGYWRKPNGYVLNTEPSFDSDRPEPAQFMVTKDNEVYGTNPIASDLDPESMIQL